MVERYLLLQELTRAMREGEAAGTVASIIDHVDRALLPYRTGSHYYALRVGHVDYDRFLLAVGSSMIALQPCNVEDVACPAGQPAAPNAFGTAPACRSPAAPTAVSRFLADVAESLQPAEWHLQRRRERCRIAEPLLSVYRFMHEYNNGSLVLHFVQSQSTVADARFATKSKPFFSYK